MAKRIKIPGSLFNMETAAAFVEQLKEKLDFYSFISAKVSTLGGYTSVTIMLVVSTTTKENWAFGILENSDYRRFAIYNDGTVENFTTSGLPKVRKFTAKSIDDVIAKINK
jgi:cytosine/uracil/thiamine/allantoin permease